MANNRFVDVFSRAAQSIPRALSSFGAKKFVVTQELIGGYSDSEKLRDGNYLKAAELVSWIGTCCSIIGEDIGAAKGGIYNGKGELVKDDDLLTLFTQPNPLQNWFEFKELWSWFLALNGNAYIYLQSETLGDSILKRPTGLMLLNPDAIAPDFDRATGVLLGYKFTTMSGTKTISKDKIIHTRLPNPRNPYVGMSKIAMIKTAANTNISAAGYNLAFFDNGAIPPFVLKTAQQLNKPMIDELEERWNSKLRGVKNHGKLTTLTGGLEVQMINTNQRDMDYDRLMKSTREEILAAFHVPPGKAGIFEGTSSFANNKEQDNSYYSNAIDPVLQRFNFPLSAIVRRWRPDYYYQFDDVIVKDLALNMTLYKDAIANGVTPNEAREWYLGQPKVDNDPAMNTRFISVALMSMADAIAPPIETPPPAAPANGQAAAPNTAAETVVKGFAPAPTPGRKATGAQRNVILRMSRLTKKTAGKKIKKAVKEYFNDQQGEVKQAFNEHFSKAAEIEGKATPAERAQAEAFLKAIKAKVFNEAGKAKIGKALKPGYTAVIMKAVADLNEVMGTSVDGGTTNPSITEGIGRLARRVGKVNDTTRDAIENNILAGVDAGESVPELAARIEHVYGVADTSRAVMIARTESSLAYDKGAILSYKDAAVEYVDVIGCEDDTPDCNATHVSIDEADQLEFHPNHRGVIVPELG